MEQYNDEYIVKLITTISLTVLFILLLMIIVFYASRLFRMGEKKEIWTVCVCVLAILLVAVLGYKISCNYYLDIKNQSYITYTGKVKVGSFFSYCYDEKETRLYIGKIYASSTGIYKGTVVYGLHSKDVVDAQLAPS